MSALALGWGSPFLGPACTADTACGTSGTAKLWCLKYFPAMAPTSPSILMKPATWLRGCTKPETSDLSPDDYTRRWMHFLSTRQEPNTPAGLPSGPSWAMSTTPTKNRQLCPTAESGQKHCESVRVQTSAELPGLLQLHTEPVQTFGGR